MENAEVVQILGHFWRKNHFYLTGTECAYGELSGLPNVIMLWKLPFNSLGNSSSKLLGQVNEKWQSCPCMKVYQSCSNSVSPLHISGSLELKKILKRKL